MELKERTETLIMQVNDKLTELDEALRDDDAVSVRDWHGFDNARQRIIKLERKYIGRSYRP